MQDRENVMRMLMVVIMTEKKKRFSLYLAWRRYLWLYIFRVQHLNLHQVIRNLANGYYLIKSFSFHESVTLYLRNMQASMKNLSYDITFF